MFPDNWKLVADGNDSRSDSSFSKARSVDTRIEYC